jgi:hypothetical protein
MVLPRRYDSRRPSEQQPGLIDSSEAFLTIRILLDNITPVLTGGSPPRRHFLWSSSDETRENIHRFDPDARWTWREEQTLVRKIDWKIMLWTCIMFCALEMDRANIRQAVTDDLLPEMGLTTNGLSRTHGSRGPLR